MNGSTVCLWGGEQEGGQAGTPGPSERCTKPDSELLLSHAGKVKNTLSAAGVQDTAAEDLIRTHEQKVSFMPAFG